jgi:hypothetical protein
MIGIGAQHASTCARFSDRERDERMARLIASIPLGHRHGPCPACDAERAETVTLRAQVESQAREIERIKRRLARVLTIASQGPDTTRPPGRVWSRRRSGGAR